MVLVIGILKKHRYHIENQTFFYCQNSRYSRLLFCVIAGDSKCTVKLKILQGNVLLINCLLTFLPSEISLNVQVVWRPLVWEPLK